MTSARGATTTSRDRLAMRHAKQFRSTCSNTSCSETPTWRPTRRTTTRPSDSPSSTPTTSTRGRPSTSWHCSTVSRSVPRPLLHDVNLPLIHAEHQVWGAKWLFDAVELEKMVPDDVEIPTFGSFSIAADKERVPGATHRAPGVGDVGGERVRGSEGPSTRKTRGSTASG